MNFNGIITRLGQEDTTKELAVPRRGTQDTWVDALRIRRLLEIEHAVCRALNELRAATTEKGFDIKRRTIEQARATLQRRTKKQQKINQ